MELWEQSDDSQWKNLEKFCVHWVNPPKEKTIVIDNGAIETNQRAIELSNLAANETLRVDSWGRYISCPRPAKKKKKKKNISAEFTFFMGVCPVERPQSDRRASSSSSTYSEDDKKKGAALFV